LGILSIPLACVVIVGIAALVVGIIAINKTGGRENIPGRGMAVAGTVLGGCSFVVMLLIAILLPALGAARRTAQRMQNSTQLRGYHQGLVIHGQSNKLYYPGVDATGSIVPNSAVDTGNSGDGDTVEARYWIMLSNGYIKSDFAISPSEVDAVTPWMSGPIDSSHYSYALLSIDGQPGIAPDASQRGSEWKETVNSLAIIIADRDTSQNPSSPSSIHTDGGLWKGSLIWNDNHSGFEQTHLHETRYGSGQLNTQDNVFDVSSDDDALMIYSGD